MPTGEKPYRVYRGGRTKGKVPLERPERSRPDRNGRSPREPKIRRPRRRWSWKRRIGIGLLILVVLSAVWAIAGYLSFRSGVDQANARLDKAVLPALANQNGLLLSKPTTMLLLGRDHENTDRRVGLNNSDSIMILRTDPSRHRLVYLSIPRDLRVPIPGHGEDRINSAFPLGGAALTIRTIEGLTGLAINHVMNKFDCPYKASACAHWQGYRFRKGMQHMNGQRALIYSRIRENQLNPADSDITRGLRQQAVMRAVMAKLLGAGTVLHLPFNGGSLLKPLTTDLSAWQFMQLGWVLKRAGQKNAAHCRLGGTPTSIGGASVIVGNEDNLSVVQMVTGRAAPQPPRPGSGQYGPGCVIGNRQFR